MFLYADKLEEHINRLIKQLQTNMVDNTYDIEIYEKKKTLKDVILYWMIIILLLVTMFFIFGTLFNVMFFVW